MAVPMPDAAELRDNGTFEALMWALARPGTPRTLPEAGLAAIVLALIDRECRVAVDDADLATAVAATGAGLSTAALADHAFMTAPGRMLEDLAVLPTGSALYPDAGATAIIAARLGEGSRLSLTGPGIETAAEIRVAGLPEGFWALRAARCRYPSGIDIFLVDGDRVVGLPRSTHVEAL